MRATTRIGQKTKHQKATNRVGKKKVGFFRRVGNKLEHIGDGMFNLGNNVGGLAAATGVLVERWPRAWVRQQYLVRVSVN